MRFEDRPLPAPAALPALLAQPVDRAWLVRAAVTHAALAQQLVDCAIAELRAPTHDRRAAALHALRGLLARRAVPAVLAALRAAPGDWLGVPDPTRDGFTLAQSALAFALEAAPPAQMAVREALRWAIAQPELRPLAIEALWRDDFALVQTHLPALLSDAPDHAAAIATRLALTRAAACEPVAEALADLPESTRRAFYDALAKHLRRTGQIARLRRCRDRLFTG